ncbi:MAG: tetratricopeptide repeat protein [Candidatus Omnitrophica bacterium]|nr:tetratricopeptide repeat protein [Candidatus Omnitrophota bacterium]
MKRLKLIGIWVLIFALSGLLFLFFIKGATKILQGKKKVSEEALFKLAAVQEAQGNLLKAKETYQILIRDYPQGKFIL